MGESVADERAMGKGYGIAAGHRQTAEAAAAMLDAGGTAMDAAVAAALTAMVAEPVLAGLMGGGFAMVDVPGAAPQLLDMFVDTPGIKRPLDEVDFREIHADFGTTTQAFHIGAGAIAASALSRGLSEAHARFGRMPFRAVAEPAIRAAREGVEVTPFEAGLGRIVAPILMASAEARALHAEADALLPAGARRANGAFADVLEEYARAGPRFVQEGEVAAAVVSLTKDAGHLTAEDLRFCQPVWRAPVTLRRAGATAALNPPPSLGGTLIAFTLGLLGPEADLADLALALEATTRARLDSAIDDGLEAGAARLGAPELVARYRAEIRGRAASLRGTTHISVTDAAGLGVALTLSNGEGCGLIAPGTGIMPNNMLGEEDLLPRGFASWAPGQRLASMMAPLTLDWGDGRRACLGSGGSNRIRSALARVVLGLVDRGMPLEAAIEAPRLHVEAPVVRGAPPRVDFEMTGLAESDREVVLAAFPEACAWDEPSMFFGGVHGVLREATGGMQAAGDPRRGGHAIVA